MTRNAIKPKRARTPRLTPTSMPAFVPVSSPLFGVDVGDVEGDEEEEEVVEDDDDDDERVKEDVTSNEVDVKEACAGK